MNDGLKELRRPMVVVPAAALVIVLVLLFLSRGEMEQLAFLRKGFTASENGPVDQRPAQTAETLAGLAVSAEEQRFAQEADRLAEHEVDEAFQIALREAALAQRAPTGAAAVLASHVDDLKAAVKADQAKVDALTAAAKAGGPAADAAAGPGEDLDVAKAQLALDTDELADASGDLARATGDKRPEIEQELAARQASTGKGAPAGGQKASAVTAVKQFRTLWGRVEAWFAQNNRVKLLEQARTEALAHAKAATAAHTALEAQASGANQAALADPATTGSARVTLLRAMASRHGLMGMLDDTIATDGQLADVYGRWEQQVVLQHRLVGHLILQSTAWVLLIVLLASVLSVAGRALVPQVMKDPRQARTLETVVTLFVEIAGAGIVLLIVFGVPAQITTVIGLATAGFAVVFQDFFLAFFGWFILMGGDGIRVNDWVEVDGVGGEVAEIGLFRTTLLETGNWTAQGHPTGRRVTLVNSFAIRGQYFNFTTHGQWMWDEIRLNLPAEPRTYELVRRMQAAVEEVTESSVAEANAEWSRVSQRASLGQFSAAPSVELRPAAAGVDVVVRFVTRAGDRFEVANRIYEAITGLMKVSVGGLTAGDGEKPGS